VKAVLGVSGSVAAYRACDLARELMRSGFEVRVCLTDSAEKFVTPALFEALTGNPCLQDVFEEPERGRMAHIDWARQADVLVIAPATANTLAKIATGVGDDMLTTIALAFDGPLVIAPAMNPTMYAAATTQDALRILEARAVAIVEPEVGDVACGENGQGKFPAIGRIVDAVVATTARGQVLRGKHVLITSGPTQEPIDSVRYLTNRSSGKMGAALAKAALLLGAQAVTVIAGSSRAVYPMKARVIPVTTAEEMLEAGLEIAPDADLIIGAAAVADYRPIHPVVGKIRRTAEDLTLTLTPNPDVIAALAGATSGRVIGFAAEPSAEVETAREKLARKGLYAIAHNNISDPSIGFDSESNALTLVTETGVENSFGPKSKLECALWLLEQIAP
jgi:phosphopantothenoylcysteine decarboxylase/phosphopantothenate--cysteine ligase